MARKVQRLKRKFGKNSIQWFLVSNYLRWPSLSNDALFSRNLIEWGVNHRNRRRIQKDKFWGPDFPKEGIRAFYLAEAWSTQTMHTTRFFKWFLTWWYDFHWEMMDHETTAFKMAVFWYCRNTPLKKNERGFVFGEDWLWISGSFSWPFVFLRRERVGNDTVEEWKAEQLVFII